MLIFRVKKNRTFATQLFDQFRVKFVHFNNKSGFGRFIAIKIQIV